MSVSTPTQEDFEELLLSCRYGDVEDIQQFVDKFGPDALAIARDDNGNTVLHMVAGNGHTGIVVAVLPRVDRAAPEREADMRKACNRRTRLSPPPASFIAPRRTQQRRVDTAALGGAEQPSPRRAEARAVPRGPGR